MELEHREVSMGYMWIIWGSSGGYPWVSVGCVCVICGLSVWIYVGYMWVVCGIYVGYMWIVCGIYVGCMCDVKDGWM